MISVEIPNDIADYKPKLMLGFTGRQVVCILLTAVVIFLDFKFLKPYIGDLSVMLAAIPAFFAAMFGWGENFTPGHIPFEKYLKSVFVQTFVAPKTRKCKTNHSFVVPCDKYYIPILDSELSPELLDAVNYVREKNGIVVEENIDNKHTLKKKRASKYKKSKLAIA